MSMIIYLFKNIKMIKAFRSLTKARTMLVRANMEIGRLSYDDDIYIQRLNEFNQAMIYTTKGRWYMDKALSTELRKDWKCALLNYRKAYKMAEKLFTYLKKSSKAHIPYKQTLLTSENTEILFADGIPLVPEINPVVIIKGSDHEMGYQYAKQVIQIFGKWVFERKAGRKFTEDEIEQITRWESQIRQYAPEILGFCNGWVAGANDSGVKMSYMDVLEIWTGCCPPAFDYLKNKEGIPKLASPLCSGAAAWGRATKDGKLVTGSTGDHDPTYMVTIVAYPDSGHSFIYTPFSVIGDVPLVGQVYMMGHPGMNSKGLAYVEHGGEMRMVEPKHFWGYGLRRGTAVFHTLRFADDARAARDMELNWPIGDIGTAMGSIGGFYADSTYGYVLESRKEPVAIREAGLLGETDFLYANNNVMHPESGKAGWMQNFKDNWKWEPHGGWYPRDFKMPDIFSLKRGREKTDRINNALSMMYQNSMGRNLYLYEMLSNGIGNIDIDYMRMVYSQSGSLPQGSWKEITRSYKVSGKWGKYSSAHAGNALVVVMKPDSGIYSLCVSEAARGLTPNVPEPNSGPLYGETNAFWELKLASGPEGTADAAMSKAIELINKAEQEFGKRSKPGNTGMYLDELLLKAKSEYDIGTRFIDDARDSIETERIYHLARAVRAFTRSQVRAMQVYQSLIPS
ncbi:MAG: hypothetical protein PHS19_06000 [Eubacteriales bacterium]|nr:hypothetical protein [Eubacteriales bacterium]